MRAPIAPFNEAVLRGGLFTGAPKCPLCEIKHGSKVVRAEGHPNLPGRVRFLYVGPFIICEYCAAALAYEFRAEEEVK